MNRDHHDAIGQFVRSIILVKGIPFYGFHSGYSPFLKILLTNPDQISRAILILQSGSVMGRKMNAFESHLSYPLQFMYDTVSTHRHLFDHKPRCDFNLYGCGWIDLKEVHYRREIDQDEGEWYHKRDCAIMLTHPRVDWHAVISSSHHHAY